MKAKSHSTIRRPGRSASGSGNGGTQAIRVPRKWCWHYRALQRLRDHLIDDLCLKLAGAAESIEPHSMDSADSATDESDRSLTVALLSGDHDALHEVDSAIRRIRMGTYGICERSGKRIPVQRLRAVPWTRFTREVEDALERNGVIRPAHLAPIASIRGSESGALARADEPEKEELQARVMGRHGLVETLEAMGQGGSAEPALEKKSARNGHDTAAATGRKFSRKSPAHAKPKKRPRAAARKVRKKKAL